MPYLFIGAVIVVLLDEKCISNCVLYDVTLQLHLLCPSSEIPVNSTSIHKF